ncbi:RNA polymerase sigma factor [Nonomuraea sp. NPDC003214]
MIEPPRRPRPPQAVPGDAPATAMSTRVQAMRADFVDFAAREHSRVIRFLMRGGASLADSQDAAQEAFTQAWRLINSEPEAWARVQEPLGWMFKVAGRCLSRPPGESRRRVSTVPVADVPETAARADDPADLIGPAVDVLAALRDLPPDQRLAIRYRMDDQPNSAVAAALGLTEQQAADLVKKARVVLRYRLAEYRTRKGAASHDRSP